MPRGVVLFATSLGMRAGRMQRVPVTGRIRTCLSWGCPGSPPSSGRRNSLSCDGPLARLLASVLRHTVLLQWAMSAAPLWSGIDLTKASKAALDVFLNKEVIAVDQDPLGHMAVPLVARGATNNQPVGVTGCSTAPSWAYNKSTRAVALTAAAAASPCLTSSGCGTGPMNPAIMWDCAGAQGGCPKNQVWQQHVARIRVLEPSVWL